MKSTIVALVRPRSSDLSSCHSGSPRSPEEGPRREVVGRLQLLQQLLSKSIYQLPLLVLPRLRPLGTSVSGKLLGTGAACIVSQRCLGPLGGASVQLPPCESAILRKYSHTSLLPQLQRLQQVANPILADLLIRDAQAFMHALLCNRARGHENRAWHVGTARKQEKWCVQASKSWIRPHLQRNHRRIQNAKS